MTALTPGIASDHWVDQIVAEAESGGAVEPSAPSAPGNFQGANLNADVGSLQGENAAMLNELLVAGGEFAWWDILFNDVSYLY